MRFLNLSYSVLITLLFFLPISQLALSSPEPTSQEEMQFIQQQKKARKQQAFGLGVFNTYYVEAGIYEYAIRGFRQALIINRGLNDYSEEAENLLQLAIAYKLLGNNALFSEYVQKAAIIVRDHHLQDLKDRMQKSVLQPNYQPSFQGLNSNRFDIGQAWKLNVLYNQQVNANQLDAAKRSLQQAISIYQAHKNGSVFDSLQSLAMLHAREGNLDQAIKDLQQAAILTRSLESFGGDYREALHDILITVGHIYLMFSKYEDAILSFQDSLELAKRGFPEDDKNANLKQKSLLNLGIAYYKSGRYSQAIDYYKNANNVKSNDADGRVFIPDDHGFLSSAFGETYYKIGQLRKAEDSLRAAIKIWAEETEDPNTLTMISYDQIQKLEEKDRIYRLIQSILLAQNDTRKKEEALLIADQARGRSSLALINLRNSISVDSTLTLEEVRQIASSQKSTLVYYSILYEDFRNARGVEDEYESQLLIWVIKASGEITLRSVDLRPLHQQQRSLTELISDSRSSIGVRDRGSIEIVSIPEVDNPKKLQELYSLLIQPIADILPQNPNEQVVFFPQGVLSSAPFPALRDHNDQYLIEKHTIAIAPSLRLSDYAHNFAIRQRRIKDSRKNQIPTKQSPSTKKFQNLIDRLLNRESLSNPGENLVVGNPIMPKVLPIQGGNAKQLPPLPGTEIEALTVADLLKTKALIGSTATKAVVMERLSSARIIHLATHGLLDEIPGILIPGAIALAPANNGELDDGLLTSEEVEAMTGDLQAELVVLSACNTGNGITANDGVIGLSRAFITAGVPSIIVSLWSVPDAPTSELMVEFYRNWQQRNMDKAQALRQAMLTTMKTYPNPRNWAGFTLVGETK